MIEVDFLDISEPDTGSGIFYVQSLGDTTKLDSLTLWVLATTSIQTEQEDGGMPVRFLSNRPNPFIKSTTIDYQLSANEEVSLNIYNIEGRLVKKVLNNRIGSGYHSCIWTGKDEQGIRVAPGIYICVLRTPNFVSIRKMIKTSFLK